MITIGKNNNILWQVFKFVLKNKTIVIKINYELKIKVWHNHCLFCMYWFLCRVVQCSANTYKSAPILILNRKPQHD